jgi:hypothetical protein
MLTVQEGAMRDDTRQAGSGAHTEDPATRSAVGDQLEHAEQVVQPERTVVPEPPPHPDYPSYRVEPDRPITLADLDPNDTGEYADRHAAKDETKRQTKRIEELQERLYAENRQSLLIVLQAIDTGGKDGTVRHVFSGVNPQGYQVWSFTLEAMKPRFPSGNEVVPEAIAIPD